MVMRWLSASLRGRAIFCLWRKERYTRRCTVWSYERAAASEWGASTNNRRAKFHRLTATARKQLAAEASDWVRAPERFHGSPPKQSSEVLEDPLVLHGAGLIPIM